MNYEEFSNIMGKGWYDKVDVRCHKCENIEHLNKGSALVNFKRNGLFLCRKCSFTPEGRKKISKATSYKRSEESKQKMSQSADEKWQTDWGKKQKKRLSKLTSKQHGSNKFDKSKRKILYISAKNDGQVRTCNSSYEYVYCEKFLELDPNVISYETQVPYEVEDRSRSLDFLITYTAGPKKAVEIKPKKRLHEEQHVSQMQDSQQNAINNGYNFVILTEDELEIAKIKEATALADAYRKQHYMVDYAAYRKKKDIQRSQKHYNKHIKNDKIILFCEFCQEEHIIMQLSYNLNVNKNGRFICLKENGSIVGSQPKIHLQKENPYAKLGHKECTKCCRILPFECFGSDKSRRDGYASRCKECRNGNH